MPALLSNLDDELGIGITLVPGVCAHFAIALVRWARGWVGKIELLHT